MYSTCASVHQREVRKTRELARTDISWAWLTADWKSGAGGSCKGCAVPPAYAQSWGCPAVLWGVLQLWRTGFMMYSNVLHRRRPLNFQYPVCAEPLVCLSSLWCTWVNVICWAHVSPEIKACLCTYCTTKWQLMYIKGFSVKYMSYRGQPRDRVHHLRRLIFTLGQPGNHVHKE